MISLVFVQVIALSVLTSPVSAQDAGRFYIQIEARTSLAGAQSSVRTYSRQLNNLNGFALGGGWYGVAVGPYNSRAEAEAFLGELVRSGAIPGDSYVESGASYGNQFWPVGAGVAATVEGSDTQTLQQALESIAEGDAAEAATAPEDTQVIAEEAQADVAPEQSQTPDARPEDIAAAEPAEQPVAEPAAPIVAPEPQPEPEETVREARQSEAQLTREERDALQIALQWAGHYQGRIDGAFGPGTRRSMASWQEANNIEPTGVLTTRQRAMLLGQYNAVLDGMGMADHFDTRAGIVMQMPLGVVSFERYEAPFAIYGPSGDLNARVLLISQPGDANTLSGLYEIMQTLEIVPINGERRRDSRGFLLIGENSEIVSHTEVGLQNGEIKGFTLIWPAGDEERRTRILSLMQESYQRTDGVLDPAMVSDEGQAVDLVSGLRVRKPKGNGSGFFVDMNGSVLTSADTVESCERVTLNGTYPASVKATDLGLGVALLTPQDPLAPRRAADFATGTQRLQSEIAVAGYSFGGVLTAPTLTFGTLEDTQGLAGETNVKRLALASLPGDVGGPVFDAGGSVMGMLLPREDAGGRVLPEQVAFAAKGELILDFLQSNGVRPGAGQGRAAMAPEDLTALATDMTVLVSCW